MNVIIHLSCPTCDAVDSTVIPAPERKPEDNQYTSVSAMRIHVTDKAFEWQTTSGWFYSHTKEHQTDAPIGRYFCPACIKAGLPKMESTRAHKEPPITTQVEHIAFYLQNLPSLAAWEEIDSIAAYADPTSKIGVKVVAKKKSTDDKVHLRCVAKCYICAYQASLVTTAPADTEARWPSAAVNRFHGAHWKTAQGTTLAGKSILSWVCPTCHRAARDIYREPVVENLISYSRIKDGNLSEHYKAGIEVVDNAADGELIDRRWAFGGNKSPVTPAYVGYNNTRYGSPVTPKPLEVIYEGLSRYKSDEDIPEIDEEKEAEVFGLKYLEPVGAGPVGP